MFLPAEVVRFGLALTALALAIASIVALWNRWRYGTPSLVLALYLVGAAVAVMGNLRSPSWGTWLRNLSG